MGHRDMIWSRHQPAQLLAWGIRFFLAAALTATGNISVSDEDIKDTISENIIDP